MNIQSLSRSPYCYLIDEDTLDELQTQEDLLYCFRPEDVDSQIDKEAVYKVLYEIIATKLSFRERQVIIMFFGFGDEPGKSITQISKELNLSRGTVTYYRQRAYQKIKKLLGEILYACETTKSSVP